MRVPNGKKSWSDGGRKGGRENAGGKGPGFVTGRGLSKAERLVSSSRVALVDSRGELAQWINLVQHAIRVQQRTH